MPAKFQNENKKKSRYVKFSLALTFLCLGEEIPLAFPIPESTKEIPGFAFQISLMIYNICCCRNSEKLERKNENGNKKNPNNLEINNSKDFENTQTFVSIDKKILSVLNYKDLAFTL